MGARAGRVSSEVQVPAPAPRSEIAPSDAAFARLVICIACLLLSWIIRTSVLSAAPSITVPPLGPFPFYASCAAYT
jgi:hypothetical protein